MAAPKKPKIDEQIIELEGELLNTVSYATYYCRQQLFTSLRVFNNGKDTLENIIIEVNGNTPLLLPTTVSLKPIPAESSMEVDIKDVLNPKYLADLDDCEECTICVNISYGKDKICTLSAPVTAIPIDYWSGTSGRVEMLSAFVRPRLPDCQKILAEAGLQLKTWGYSSEWSGYAGNNKNAVRNAVAAMFSAMRRLEIVREEQPDVSTLVPTGDISHVIKDKRATPLRLALLFASCLESSKLNPVIVLGRESVGVGVWLYESCFTSPAQDDMSIVEKYVTEGINNLCIFDVNDMFAHTTASFTTSETHFAQVIRGGKVEVLIDVKRCRIGGIFPLPIRVKNGKHYELLTSSQFSYEEKPTDIIDAEKFKLGSVITKGENWKRKLLDLSLKNNLLNFRYKRDCLHLVSGSLTPFVRNLSGIEKLNVIETTTKSDKIIYFGKVKSDINVDELIRIEMASGNIHASCQRAELQENSSSLIRKARTAQEEIGSNTLYMAIGFLKWRHEGEREDKFAPLVLLPVTLKKTKLMGTVIELGDDYEVNTTLLEFLKQDFGIDIRGLEGSNLSIEEIIAVFRSKTAKMKGWGVYEDVYVAQFTFARYAMWQDVKDNLEKYKDNEMIASLLSNTNKLSSNNLFAEREDNISPMSVLTPLTCDSSQFEAVAESLNGTTFVLHGPPGTGKSQTITNIIAASLHAGKRVLFVAEKQAALQVVAKRLAEVGLGDFCIELTSGKVKDKNQLIASIEHTLSLAQPINESKLSETVDKIEALRATLKKPLAALHKKRRLGVSVYEGILYYLQNKNAPELMNIESTFYDSLTKKKLADYESMLLTAQAAAKECGGVYRSPFEQVNIYACDDKLKGGILCAAEVVLAELKHLKNYLGLFLDTFNQKISTFTLKKLEALIEVATILKEDRLKTFFNCDEEAFYKFFNANIRYDSEVKHWLKTFKTLPDISKLAPYVEEELEKWGDNYRSSKVLLAVIKRINRCGRGDVPEKDEVEWIKRAFEIDSAHKQILANTPLSSNFIALGGGINDKKREEFLRPLYAFHALCQSIFMDYNPDSFNSVCISSMGGHLKPLISGLLSACVAFVRSIEQFIKIIKANKDTATDEDLFEYFSAKCSALIDNIDMLPAWCMYKQTAKKLNDSGLTFITDAMESGRISGEQILASFRKNVYRNFIQTNIPADDDLAEFSANVLDESSINFAQVLEEYYRQVRETIRAELISRLPSQTTEGALALELMTFTRQIKAAPKSVNTRKLFTEIPELMKVVSPCLLMSPTTVSQYLPAQTGMFDLVIFDEASQIPTCEAVPSLARARNAIIVGDPKQMPPTSFFMGSGVDEEHLEASDLDSLLDDCLALGIPERHLNWHYRSKHESLIAFSNIMYYSGKLCTFPSPDALDSKVTMRYIENGVYERGESKCNKLEAKALVEEVIRRLKDDKLKKSSIGIVTFSTPQQDYILKLLNKAINEHNLEEIAYEREEPLFVKNLENVQGDERDVILFSVCFGPDMRGKISLNFGPLNQLGGWRRLNVAVSRAREEMVVFSSMRYSMIDLSRTTSRGVAGLKAFLEFAEKGRTSIAVKNDEIIVHKNSIGKYVAEELKNYGYDCRCNVGVSDFKIDVAVLDPKNKHTFILAIICDGTEEFSIKDRNVMQIQTLKRNNWNVLRLYSINFFNNPKREIKKIKEYLDRLTSGDKVKSLSSSYKRAYKYAKVESKVVDSSYILSGDNDIEIMKTIKAVLLAEEPISANFLVKRTLSFYGIQKYGSKLDNKIKSLITACAFKSKQMMGVTYYYKTDKLFDYDRYRVEGDAIIRTTDSDYTPFDIISLIKSILLNKVSVYQDELIVSVIKELKIPRAGDKITSFITGCIDLGIYEGIFVRSISDRISLT